MYHMPPRPEVTAQYAKRRAASHDPVQVSLDEIHDPPWTYQAPLQY
jgi:hypothetical protein